MLTSSGVRSFPEGEVTLKVSNNQNVQMFSLVGNLVVFEVKSRPGWEELSVGEEGNSDRLGPLWLRAWEQKYHLVQDIVSRNISENICTTSVRDNFLGGAVFVVVFLEKVVRLFPKIFPRNRISPSVGNATSLPPPGLYVSLDIHLWEVSVAPSSKANAI